MNALIIEDNPKNVNVLVRLLEMEGIKSIVVPHPQDLADKLENIGSVAVVFLDLEMPGMDGFQVKDYLRADPRFDGTPIVAYTVHVSEITVVHAQGFDSFIAKPLDSDRFPDQLARILRGEPVWET